MRFLNLCLFAGLALAQTTTNTASNAQSTCLAACAPTDVNCQAMCVGAPHPGNAQMNLTTNCIANCPQGDGSPAAIQTYSSCQQACISSYIILSGTAAPGGAYSTAGQTPANSAATATGTPKTLSMSTSLTVASTTSKGLAVASTGVGIGGAFGLAVAAFGML